MLFQERDEQYRILQSLVSLFTLRPKAEENHCLASGIKVTKVLSFSHPSQKENKTLLYFMGSS